MLKKICIQFRHFIISSFKLLIKCLIWIAQYIIKMIRSLFENIEKINIKLINSILNQNSSKIAVKYTIIFLCGRLVSFIYDMRFSLIHQLNLSIISYTLLIMLKDFYNVSFTFEKEFHGKNVVLYFQFKNLSKKVKSMWNIVIPFLACSVFVFVIFFLEYLPLNVMGIFGAFMATSSFFLALMAYYAFVNCIIVIFHLQKIDAEQLPFTYPDDVKGVPFWIRSLQDVYEKAYKSILIVGTLFTLEYILLMPPNVIEFDSEFRINSNHPIIFLYNWVIIAAFIIIACPIMLFLIRKYLNQLISNIYSRAKEYVDSIFNKENISIEHLSSYYHVLNNLKSPDMYALKKQVIYSVFATTLSLVLNIAKVYESYLVPFLRSTF